MNEYELLKLAFVKALPNSVIDLLSDVTRCKAEGDERFRRLSETNAVVMMALGHGTFSHDDLLTLAAAVGAEPAGENDNQLADAVFDRMLAVKLQADLGELYTSFAEFMEEVKQRTEPILLLKPDASGAIDGRVVCYFNPRADFETDWLSVDLTVHPDPTVRSNRILSVRLDDYEKGSVVFTEGSDLRQQDDWVPLFAHAHVELPSPELEEESEVEFPIDFPREEFIAPYESLASCSNLMTRPGFLHRQMQYPPLGAYAQLGGRPYPWVEESLEEQAGRRVVIRTHANSEPWVEVSQDSGGDCRVVPHIT